MRLRILTRFWRTDKYIAVITSGAGIDARIRSSIFWELIRGFLFYFTVIVINKQFQTECAPNCEGQEEASGTFLNSVIAAGIKLQEVSPL